MLLLKSPYSRPTRDPRVLLVFPRRAGRNNSLFLLCYRFPVLHGKPQFKLFSGSSFPRRAGKSIGRMIIRSLAYCRGPIKTILLRRKVTFRAQNWFHRNSERFGAFLAIFKIFNFLEFLVKVFWSEKWAKKVFFSQNVIFLCQKLVSPNF